MGDAIKAQLSTIKEALTDGAIHALPAALIYVLIKLTLILPADLADELSQYAEWLVMILLPCRISIGIANRPGTMLGIMAGLTCIADGSGVIGAIIGGILGGYITELCKKLGLPAVWRAPLTMIIIPLIGSFILFMLMRYMLDPPLVLMNEWIRSLLPLA